MSKMGFLRAGLVCGALFCGSSVFGLQLEESRRCWLGESEKLPTVSSVRVDAKSGDDDVVAPFDLTFPSLLAAEVETDQGSFSRFSIPSVGVSAVAGSPNIPVYRKELLLDLEGSYECRATVLEEQVWSLRDVGLPLMPIPVLRAVPKVPGAMERASLSMNPAAYTDCSEQSVARLVKVGAVQGKMLFLLEVCPAGWNADDDSVVLRKRMSVEVVRVDAPGVSSKRTKGGSGSVSNRLLVVAADGLVSSLDGFVDHKEARGWTVDVVSASDAGSTRDAIRAHIQGRYIREDLCPSHLLLVGDSDTIPVWTGVGAYTPDTDLYYACMDGASDWLPDMAIARFPVRTSAQLSNLVQKVISYETSVTELSSFVSNAAFAASSDNYSLTEGTHNSVIARHFDPHGYASGRLFSHTQGAGTTEVLSALNDGRSFVTYSGHGYAHKWRDPALEISDVHSLTNNDQCSFVASFACDTGSFATLDECFAEAWLRTGSSVGGVAVLSSSEDSYWTEDDILEKSLYDALFIDQKTVLGDLTLQAKQRYLAHYGVSSETRQYFEQYNLLGDPTMSLVVLEGNSQGDQARAVRDLPDAALSTGEVFSVTLNVWVTNPPPSGLIIKEVLPSGWTVSNAMWNGSSMAPSYSNGEYKWLFGLGASVGSGTLTYDTQANGSFGEVHVINGAVLYGSTTVVTTGDQPVSLSAIADADNDGMPDDWELLHGLNPMNSADALENWDGDSFSNREEYFADTNPTNTGSALFVTDIRAQNGVAHISWEGGQNAVQYFECTDDLLSNSWKCIRIFSPPTERTNSLSITNDATTLKRYFRVRSAR